MTSDAEQAEQAERPLLRVVRGDATPEEVAALVAVLQAAGQPASAPDPPAREWGSPRRAVRAPLAAARGGWRASAFPG